MGPHSQAIISILRNFTMMPDGRPILSTPVYNGNRTKLGVTKLGEPPHVVYNFSFTLMVSSLLPFGGRELDFNIGVCVCLFCACLYLCAIW